jgi:hypothetical protein
VLTLIAGILLLTNPFTPYLSANVLGQDLSRALVRVSLTPETLAAAGVSPNQTTGVVSNLQEYLASNLTILHQTDAAVASSESTVAELRRRIQSGKFNESDLQGHAAAVAQAASSTAQRETLLNDMFHAAIAELPHEVQEVISTIRSNVAWQLPTEFLTVSRPEADWVDLKGALANERIAAKLGEEPDGEAQQLLLQARAHPSVSSARALLQENLNAVANSLQSGIIQ